MSLFELFSQGDAVTKVVAALLLAMSVASWVRATVSLLPPFSPRARSSAMLSIGPPAASFASTLSVGSSLRTSAARPSTRSGSRPAPQKQRLLAVGLPAAARSARNERNGATPVPGPIITIGVSADIAAAVI